ncbi:MAG: stage V sporulation protein AD [Bacilli bacterium]|nr:stage V sporulation protein AD [Bacilli bacterium]
MTIKYDNVYLNETATITGPIEAKGPLGNLFDKSYDSFYIESKSWEQSEIHLLEKSVEVLLGKIKKSRFDIDLHISGELLNQLVATNYAGSRLGIPLLGIYSACATSTEGLIIGANMISAKQVNNCICSASSHNNGAEKQFRYPVEYGGPKPDTASFTTTGSASAFLSKNKKGIKIESGTIGIAVDMGLKDANNMGAIMAAAAGDTIYRHLSDTKREVNYYDLILTGDLGKYGKQILIDYMRIEYGIILNNYNDTGTMIYDLENQDVHAGGSGPACAPLVTYSFIFNKMKNKELTKVLLVATGSLQSVVTVNQKMTIPSIAHAVSLEALS